MFLFKPLEKNLCNYMKYLIDGLFTAKVKPIGLDLAFNPNKKGDQKANQSFGKYSLLPATQTHGVALSETMTLLQFCTSISKPLAPIIATGATALDPTLYCNMLRLFRVLLDEEMSNGLEQEKKEDKSQSMSNIQNKNGNTDTTSILNIIQEDSVFNTLRSFIIPSLSLFPCNPAMSSEVWNVITILPYQIRYTMYSLWRKHGLAKTALRSISNTALVPLKPLKQIQSEVQTSIATKYYLKRMSKDNIKDMGKQISKIAHNNPLVVFTLILNQIESYDNLILMMVDMFKFMGNLSLDVMGYCLLVSLGGEETSGGRNKLKGK